MISSLASEPFWLTTSKPAPISTPFTAFIDIIPCANNASNLSNTGSPNPIGIFLPIIVTLAPIESPDFLILVKYSSSSMIFFLSGKKKGFFSISAIFMLSALISPSCDTYPKILVLLIFDKYFFAIAPAATRATVSRADDRPAPL